MELGFCSISALDRPLVAAARLAAAQELDGIEVSAHPPHLEPETPLEAVRAAGSRLPRRPRVYFEEWDEPQISAIQWVGEIIGIAGGVNCFPELAAMPLGRDRIIADPAEVVRRAPDMILGSWCGKKFRPARVAARPGWDAVPAVRDGELHEIKSAIILQPGPAALTDGLAEVHAHIRRWAGSQ